MCMTERRCSAPRIVKFESRFNTTVNIVHNLALLAGLLTCLHTFTHALAHAHRLTLAHSACAESLRVFRRNFQCIPLILTKNCKFDL